MKGSIAWATLMRSSEDDLGSLMMPNKNSSGKISGFAAAAASAAFLSAVFLFGVPRWRPPRLSPGFDPLGIAIFAFCTGLSAADSDFSENCCMIVEQPSVDSIFRSRPDRFADLRLSELVEICDRIEWNSTEAMIRWPATDTG